MSIPDIITIDGPAASGKSSVSKLLSKITGHRYINSGAFYRGITYAALAAQVDPASDEQLHTFIKNASLTTSQQDRETVLLIHGHPTTDAQLRDAKVNANVSQVSRHPAVREKITRLLRSLVEHGPLVMEGRDIGSVVFPEADCKFYIDANEEVRATRRSSQGEADTIALRDALDSTRKHAPLKVAEDAHVIDSSHLTLEGVVGEIIGRLRKKGYAVDL